MKAVALLSLAILCAISEVKADPPPGFWPPGISNIGRVWIYECIGGVSYHGWGACIRVEPAAWGQLCDPGGARFAAETWHEQNKPFSYILRESWWQCQSQMDPKTAPWPMSGPL